MDTVVKCFSSPSESTTTAVVATTVVTTLALASLTHFALWPRKPQIIPGALTTSVPRLSKEELSKSAYRTDHFPGARDVVTPVRFLNNPVCVRYLLMSALYSMVT